MARKYLLTGGTGFIGTALVKRLLSEGNELKIYDNNSRGRQERLQEVAGEVEIVEGDIRDRERLIAAARGMDSLIHLAYINGTEFFYSQPELVLDVAIRGALNVIDACRVQGIGELILSSSSEVYQSPAQIPTSESVPLSIPDPFNPRFSYGGGKIACELMAINYGRKGFERVLIFRPHNVYGPDMGWEHVLPQFILRAVEAIKSHPQGAVPFPIQGDGSQTRAFIYIDDFIDALSSVLRDGQHLNVYHIGNPQEISIAAVAKQLFKYFGREVGIIAGPLPPGSTPRRCPDISKLQKLGFRPRISFEQGLAATIEWYARAIQEGRSPKY
ncbi:MAG: NAD-dependent epimerase/dehydratase family protein [Syntrophomonas sp.]|uniref:NAD-dependent epimerase/dehydratase family protein n=1 Tax=Syntrophomonas sp. TaxID=2053627 RepID=UPI002605E411|nr:NAD-dependent epimerase/dehydratase family protein [Syntrophomonas sp.]MDD3879927.1 NAD-dependent epimerase/dehydratase family protein [Syntrophomonas sp.]MDD4627724.1 NAD-dependent epimerase/dehydratase family protein [Syntrophomonas sp.]